MRCVLGLLVRASATACSAREEALAAQVATLRTELQGKVEELAAANAQLEKQREDPEADECAAAAAMLARCARTGYVVLHASAGTSLAAPDLPAVPPWDQLLSPSAPGTLVDRARSDSPFERVAARACSGAASRLVPQLLVFWICHARRLGRPAWSRRSRCHGAPRAQGIDAVARAGVKASVFASSGPLTEKKENPRLYIVIALLSQWAPPGEGWTLAVAP